MRHSWESELLKIISLLEIIKSLSEEGSVLLKMFYTICNCFIAIFKVTEYTSSGGVGKGKMFNTGGH